MKSKIILLFFVLLSVLLLSLYVHSQAGVSSQGGFITELNLTVVAQTTYWQGFMGDITFGIGATAPGGINASGGNISGQNFFLTTPCNNPTSLTGHIIFANTSNAPTGLVAGNISYLDSLVTTGDDSPSKTFNLNGTFFLEGANVTNVPTVYTFVNNTGQNSTFKEGFLQDAAGNLVFVTQIEQDQFGYNTSTFDFQVMIPILNNTSPTPYSIFADLVYTCPINDTWNITAPGRLFERLGIYNQTLTLPTIQLQISELTTNGNNTIECIIQTSNSSITKNLTHKVPAAGYSSANITLNYTILPGDPDGNILKTWFLMNCSVYNTTGGLKNTTWYNDSDYPVYVKTTPWYRLVSGNQVGIDVANAYIAYKFNQRSYFGHNDTTQYDVNFAFRKLIGTFKFEAICDDGIDNDADGKTDAADNDCYAIFFGSANHTLYPQMGGIGTYGFQTMSTPANGCPGNICSFTLGTGSNVVTVYYTQEGTPGGQFKIRFIKSSISNQITFMTTSSVGTPYFNVTDGGTNLYNLSGTGLQYKILLPETGPPFTRVQANSRQNVTDATVFNGNLDQVINITLNQSLQPGNYTINFDAFIGSGLGDLNFTFYIDVNESANRNESDPFLNRSHTSILLGTQKDLANACNDGINNDLLYDNVDCADCNCNGEIVGVSQYGDPLGCECLGEVTCWDGFDNDNDGLVDCADSNCTNSIGAFVNASGLPEKRFIPGANVVMCEIPNEGIYNYTSIPSSCNDSFDNDADNNPYLVTSYSTLSTDPFAARGKNIDCYDYYSCWGRGGTVVGNPCPLFENVTNASQCNDTLDNDHDADIQNSSAEWLGIFIPDPGLDGTGADCDDYDCKGSPYCPSIERNFDNTTCFDNIDNDLDAYIWNGSTYVINPLGGIDCNDPDCLLATNPYTGATCLPREFNIYQWNFCWDTIDNDFDGVNPTGQSSCIDNRYNSSNSATSIFLPLINYSDCWAMFGYCGPCPTYENYTAFSCGDGIDNDYDDGAGIYGISSAGLDCSDSDCTGEFGNRQGDLCVAANAENTVALCSDDFDNDADGSTDCADSNCAAVVVSGGTCGTENTVAFCNDDFDNDHDGDLDCADSGCFGVGVCSPAPSFGSLTTIPTSTSGSVQNGDINFNYINRVHLNKPEVSNWTIRLTSASGINHGSGIVQVVLGTSLNNLSFNLNESNITISGPSASDFSCGSCVDYTSGVLNLEDSGNDGLSANGGSLDLTVSIPVPADHPLGLETFPISANTGCAVGCGVSQPLLQSFTVYENTPPRIEKIEIEPSASPKTILVGDTIAIRAIANDTLPSGGLTDSNIYRCNFYLSSGATSSETDCIYEPSFNADGSFTIYINATDTVGNTNDTEVSTSFTVDVKPKDTTTNYSLGNASFFNSTLNIINIGTFSFQTGSTDTFTTTCLLIYKDTTGAIVATDSSSISNSGASSITCSGTATLPAAVLVTDGAYYLSVNVTDSDGDTVESSPKALFVCKSLTSSGTRFNCLESDFDNDGATEGIISNFTFFNNNTNTTINLTCDACPGQVNLNQDVDGDGIDDICDGALPTQCSDGIDNDLDGYIDYPADPGCTSAADNDESGGAVAPAAEGGAGGGGDGWDPRFSSARTIWSAYEEEPIVPPEVEELPYKPKPKPKPALPKPEIPKAFALAKLPREITVNYMLESLIPIILRIIIFLLLWTIFKKTKKYFSKL